MGRITAGILGGVAGKVGQVVGGTWKGIDYLRIYKIPANPQTAAQQLHRARFAAMIAKSKACLATVITNYWNPFAVKMSGFNNFVKKNILNLAATTYYWTTSNVMSEGSLEGASIATAVLAANDVTITWSESILGNGELTDDVDLLVVNKETNALYQTLDTYTRTDETGVVDCGSESDASKLIAFMVFKRGSGSSYVVSDSSSLQVTA